MYFNAKNFIFVQMVDNKKLNLLKVVLAKEGVNQKELALKLGITPNAVSMICTHKSELDFKRAYQIAKVLKIDARRLMNEPDRFVEKSKV